MNLSRLYVFESEMDITINTDRTATVKIQHDGLGKNPLVRVVRQVQVVQQLDLIPETSELQQTEREQLVAVREQATEQRDKAVAEREQATEQRNQAVAEREQAMEQWEQAVTNREHLVAEREQTAEDWSKQERETLKADLEERLEQFCFRKAGDKCSRCNVVKCPQCPFMHEDGRCFATGRECFYCGGIGHYQSKCPKKRTVEANNAFGRK